VGTIWRPLREPGTLATRAADEIERLIEERRYRPGQRLPSERKLAGLLGVSRATVREGVRRLEARGRLEVRHGSGVWVLPWDPLGGVAREASLRELFAMREILEVPAAGWAAERARPDDIEGLRQLLEELEELGRRPPLDFDRLRQLDISFHLAIATLAGNRFLRQVMGVLHDMLEQGMETTLAVPGRLARARAEHGAVLEALAAGNPMAARRAMRRHIRNAQAAALRRASAVASTRGRHRALPVDV
jgi:GntR family transcriptional repressor for pyruvate dehydrogenase complex